MAIVKDTTGKTDKAIFGTPAKVWDVTETIQRVEDYRAADRAKINILFNGQRPYSPDEEKKFNIQVNVNWGEGKRIMLDANRQLNSALIHPGILFNCTLEEGKIDKRDEWSAIFTKNIHVPLQRGRSGKKHNFLIRSRNASMCMHGIGALMWTNDFRWMPRFVALEDLLIPTDTYCDFGNITYFAVNLYLSPGEFAAMTQGDKADRGWNQPLCREILDHVRDLKPESMPSTWRNQPEAMAEVFKQNQGYYYNDAITKIRLRAFYFQDVNTLLWYRHIILRESVGTVSTDEFVYDGGDKVFANGIDHILNVQYGDVSLVAPLKYHSVRGLGVDLYAPVETINRLRCEFVQATFEHLKMYFRIQDPADRDRLKQVVLQQFGFIPEGLSIIPRDQRHQIDASLVDNAMGQMRQIMQESSASFLQDTATAENKTMTAKEATIRLNQATMMISGMLGMMYIQENFYYEELVRRFCRKESADAEVKQFRDSCIKDGIPENLLDSRKWKVSAERVLGGGDRSLAQAEAQWLLEHKTEFDPSVQQTILRMATRTILDDPAKANMLVPEAPPEASAGTYAAEDIFGTMMHGIKVSLRTGIDQQGYIESLLRMMEQVVQCISATDNMGTIDDLIGLSTVAQNISQHIMILAGDEAENQRVKQYGDALGQLMNEIKGFAQRQAQARGAMNGEQKESISINYKDAPPDIKRQMEGAAGFQPSQDPSSQIDPKLLKAKTGLEITQAKFAQKQQQDQAAFNIEQARQNMLTVADIKRKDLAHRSKLINDSMSATIDGFRELKKAKSKPSE